MTRSGGKQLLCYVTICRVRHQQCVTPTHPTLATTMCPSTHAANSMDNKQNESEPTNACRDSKGFPPTPTRGDMCLCGLISATVHTCKLLVAYIAYME